MRLYTLSVSLLLLAAPLAAGDTFLDSDDYEERNGAIGVFLTDEDYALMIEDLERNDTEFDWGWVKTTTWSDGASDAGDARRGVRKLFSKRGPKVGDTRALAFDLAAFDRIAIPPVQNFAGIMKAELLEEIHDAFVQAATALGLEVVESRDGAELELALATVDQMRSSVTVPVYGINVKPFVVLELRLVEIGNGETLLLVRNRKHGGTVDEAAFNFADDFVKFLR